MNASSINKVVQAYGPFAFGVASFMAMWIAIVQPELDVRRIEFDQHTAVLQQLNQQMRDQERTNNTIHDTAVVLDRVVNKLERMQGAVTMDENH